MAWFGITVAMTIRPKTGQQYPIPIWENVYLINAPDVDQAVAKAEAIGKESERAWGGASYGDEPPAEWVCKGVRRVVELPDSYSMQNAPWDGAEITSQTLELQNEQALADYMDGREVTVKMVD